GSHLQAHDGEGLCHLAHEGRKQAPKKTAVESCR
ncbi:hypothetical protein LINPERPRIM_LOCUS14635, partial [Linum perenne]